ncbi:M56 family metallopeptidase [Salinibacterium hongtaonis]|uniref:M56 family metallopeptidase n=1 Tax=Homoserinimonas hongtaonis TaxID=2079791 RepID=UPI0018EE842C|nr:M56 family metallopeptidase [Salinibacterium hongtaonis]
MLQTSIALAVLAVLLAWPVPILLARATWPSRSPAVALIVWQAVALAGGLSMIGALLVYGLQPFGDNLLAASGSFASFLQQGTLPSGADFVHMFALSGAILLTIHLLLNLMLALVRDERSRRRHRDLVRMLSSPLPERPDTLLLAHDAPVAYCLPGATRSITVLSAGLMSILDDQELRAVVAHEEAHATQRHYLVLLAFRAWRRSLPWFPIATRAQDAVASLVEMLADDKARLVVADATLARAIALVAIGGDGWRDSVPLPAADRSPTSDVFLADEAEQSVQMASPSSALRIARLREGHRPLSFAVRAVAVALAIALLAVPTALLLLPAI